MFHNGKLMMKEGNGPFFYLPKVMWDYKHYTVPFLLSQQKQLEHQHFIKEPFENTQVIQTLYTEQYVLKFLAGLGYYDWILWLEFYSTFSFST